MSGSEPLRLHGCPMGDKNFYAQYADKELLIGYTDDCGSEDNHVFVDPYSIGKWYGLTTTRAREVAVETALLAKKRWPKAFFLIGSDEPYDDYDEDEFPLLMAPRGRHRIPSRDFNRDADGLEQIKADVEKALILQGIANVPRRKWGTLED